MADRWINMAIRHEASIRAEHLLIFLVVVAGDAYAFADRLATRSPFRRKKFKMPTGSLSLFCTF